MISRRTVIISIIIVLVLASSALAVIFIPMPAITTFNKLNTIVEYEQRKGISQSLLDLQTKGYGENFQENFNTSHLSIINARKKILGESVEGKVTIDAFSFYSYVTLSQALDNSLGYYIISSKIATGASRSEQREVEKITNELKRNIDIVDNNLKTVYDRQQALTDSDSGINALTTAYRTLQNNYRKLLLSKASLTLQLKKFVIKNAFNNNFMDTTYSVLNDCFAYAVKAAMSVTYESENGYLYDCSMVHDKIKDFNNGANIFTLEITERSFILSFKDLYNNYNTGLENMFYLPHEIKSNVVNNNNFTNSFIRAEYQQKVRNILVLIGIN